MPNIACWLNLDEVGLESELHQNAVPAMVVRVGVWRLRSCQIAIADSVSELQ